MYNFDQALEKLELEGRLTRIKKEVTLEEVPNMIKKSNKALLFQNTGTDYQIASNVCTRENFCAIFDMNWKELQEKVAGALDNPIDPKIIDKMPFIEVEANLKRLPILKYYDSDPGPYITSGVFITECEERNLSYHRILVKSEDTCTTRICQQHHEMLTMMQNTVAQV